MNAQPKPRSFPLPSSIRVIPGTERAQAAYPYHVQFTPEDDGKFWFYNSMHFPEPMSAFDMVTAEAAYCALGAANTRVHCLPTTLGIDHRIINGRVYIGGNAVTDPAEIARRTEEFQKRAFYLLRELGDAVRAMEAEDAGADRGGAGAAGSLAARIRAAGARPRRTRRRVESRAARDLPKDARRLLPDVAPPFRVSAARLRRVHDVLRLLQEGVSGDHGPDHRAHGGRHRRRDLPPGRGAAAARAARRRTRCRQPFPRRRAGRGRARLAPRRRATRAGAGSRNSTKRASPGSTSTSATASTTTTAAGTTT